MNKVEAIEAIVLEARSERQPDPVSWRRLIRAMRALEIEPAGMHAVMCCLDFVRQDGRPWNAEIPEKDVPWRVGPWSA